MFKAFDRTHLYLGGVILAAIITAVISAVLVIIDQVIKYFVLGNLHSGDNVPFIGNLLTLTYVEKPRCCFWHYAEYELDFCDYYNSYGCTFLLCNYQEENH